MPFARHFPCLLGVHISRKPGGVPSLPSYPILYPSLYPYKAESQEKLDKIRQGSTFNAKDKGKEIAEGVAERLGYDCISRDLLLETSRHFNIPEIKLVRALHDAPSVLERFTYGKEKYLAFLQCTFLEHAQKDNLVHHGLAGHFMLKGVDHVLKVRILADIEDRVRLEMDRENISKEEALKALECARREIYG